MESVNSKHQQNPSNQESRQPRLLGPSAVEILQLQQVVNQADNLQRSRACRVEEWILELAELGGESSSHIQGFPRILKYSNREAKL